MMSGDRIAFLTDRVDEDEWVALAAARTDDGHAGNWLPMFFSQAALDARVDDHLARHDPARVLRDVAAKRAHLAEWEKADAAYKAALGAHARDAAPDRSATMAKVATASAVERAWYMVLRIDSGCYSNHPSYQQEWTP